MRRIEASGGLELGPEGGPWIDVVPVPPRRVELSEAEKLAGDPETLWRRMPREGRLAMPGGWAIAGLNSRLGLSLRFLRPQRMGDTTALRRIAKVDRIPPAVAGAVLAAAAGLRRKEELAGRSVGVAPATIARTCTLQPAGPETACNAQEIREMASHFPQAVITGESVDLPTGSVDRARLWLAVSRALWEPEVLRQVGRSNRAGSETTFMAGQLAAAHALLSDLQTVDLLGGATAHLQDDDLARTTAWPQALEFAAGGVSQDALSWLNGGHMPFAFPTVDRALIEGGPVPPTPDPDLAKALARQFLDEAEGGVYAPAGAFEVDIPEELHLSDWGVGRLKVWCEADHLWCGAIGEDGLSCVFQWSPGEELRDWVICEPVKPAVHATLAALWRDLRVVGEDVLPATGERRMRSQQGRATLRPGSRRRRTRRRRTLPGRRYVRLSGHRRWGTDEERERIIRRAHGVRGHLRRLPEG